MLNARVTAAASVWLHVLVAGLGVAVWVVPWVLLDGTEAWDHSSYFLISLPVMTIACGLAGFRLQPHPWRWPLMLYLVQMVTMLVLGGGPGNLFPLGLVALAILSVPLAIATGVGAWCATRRERKHVF